MSVYTMELHEYLEFLTGFSINKNDTETIIKNSEKAFFINANYECFNEEYRKELNYKILRHFYFREIGFETPNLFRNRLSAKLIEIMPYYNKLLIALAEKENLFDNINYTIIGNNSGNSKTKSNQKGNGNSVVKDRYSDTPQGSLSNVENNSYLTSVNITDNDNSYVNNNQNESEYKDTSTVTHSGRNGENYYKLIRDFASKTINIDMMIMDELEPFFMTVY